MARRNNPSLEPIAPAMTTGELIRELQRLDPAGTMQVALSASGGQVRPIGEVVVDTLHVAHNDHTFATRGRYHFDIMKKLCDLQKGDIVCLD